MYNDTIFSKEHIENIKTELESTKNSSDLNAFLQKHLDKEHSEQIKKVLSEPQKIKEILSTPFAKQFMEKYGNKE